MITGRPGIGKTTAIKKVADLLRTRGVKVGGMITLEVRERGRRVGFKIVDLATGREGVLAWVGSSGGPRVGKYVVNLRDLEDVGVRAILDAIEFAEVVFCDEIGPMELHSDKFKEAIERALASDKQFVGTIHIRADRDPFCRYLKERYRLKIIELTLANRDRIPLEISSEILRVLGRT